ncbi:hypothetical protein BABINDRAFT_172091 [Babjeviella inositovora NRRL Y-12698]|uniref:JmjC domain-containing protein n=1 Tax=Babjeviella inositovora NRRL Y-12698 TaxID=984486 RepID=A0A1E3QM93_9ASCO|nr:uncharacterized protein BABINDRAFT_172091 [Babjeviella inositovora NRRL Y-12698]ODQ78801.1 hypothetical protein BABINDRAFT_172091 [Babjeviella inositovora NRRL Y-12698]
MADYSKYLRLPLLDIVPDHYEDGVPVFTPTYAEFKDFYHFQRSINRFGMESGVVKVIPPHEWVESLGYTQELYESVRIRNPIVQQINMVQNGVFAQQNVERQRGYSLAQWKGLSEQANYQPPAERGGTRTGSTTKPPKLSLRDFHIDISQYTPERCLSLEKTYWRTLNYAEPMYGADTLGSVFNPKVSSWNVSNLPNILDLMDEKLPGVNDAYLYAGLWKATFAWHLEDQDLYSINYIHLGAPKQWYAIPQSSRAHFFEIMKDLYPDEYRHCHDFLRHKTFLVAPKYLEAHGVVVNKVVHRQGEFMITYPYGYHCGFNYGYNLAESVNFALDYWFEVAEKTTKCECIDDSVGINVTQLNMKWSWMSWKFPAKKRAKLKYQSQS